MANLGLREHYINADEYLLQMSAAFSLLFEHAEDNPEKFDIDTGIGVFKINGVEYQVQISLVANKNRWCDDGFTRYSESISIKENA